MEIIPVVDLRGGMVVHARRGDRAHYQPLDSILCDDASPDNVAAALLQRFPARRLYIADLDAIGGGGDQLPIIRSLLARHPGLEIWIDAAFRDRRSLTKLDATPGMRPVIGSETLTDLANLAEMLASRPDAVLSLDFRGDAFLGPPTLPTSPHCWPERVVHLDLAQVGSESGPALSAVTRLRRLAPQQRLYVGGGVRDAADLRLLRQAGVDGALLATALHNGTIGADALRMP